MYLRRFLAFLIDCAILLGGLILLQGLMTLLTRGLPGTLDGWGLYLWCLVTISAPVWCYFILLELWPPHATVGKRMMRLEVFSTTYLPINTTRAARRTALKLLPTWEFLLASVMLPVAIWSPQATLDRYAILVTLLFLLTNILLFFISKGHRSLHDLLSKTRVDSMPRGHPQQPPSP